MLVIHFLLARSLLRDASLPSRAFLETRLKALLNLNSFHDVGQGDALPTLNPVDEADGVDPKRDRREGLPGRAPRPQAATVASSGKG